MATLNNIEALKKSDSLIQRILTSLFNVVVVLIPLLITIKYCHQHSIPLSAITNIIIFYLILTIGTILSWWVPYLFGSSEKHKAQFAKFKNTHHFLSICGNSD